MPEKFWRWTFRPAWRQSAAKASRILLPGVLIVKRFRKIVSA